MKNIEKYYDVIKRKLQKGSFKNLGCAVYDFRTKGDDCPEGIDCEECCLKNFEWLYKEDKDSEDIPTAEEKNIEKTTLDTEELEITYYNL